jgi:bacterioferritin
MECNRGGEGILSQEMSERREEIIELLKKAYFMELETVMNYVSNSVNPDGVRLRRSRSLLRRTSRRSWGMLSSLRPVSRSYTV